MKIGIISGSVREGRRSSAVAKWVLDGAAGRGEGFEYEVIELADFNVPLMTSPTPPGALGGKYEQPEVRAWSDAVAACDAFVFVTPEYNHGIPGGFKNAFDWLAGEWTRKPVAFVGYGANHGVRAVEMWRLVVANFHMFDVRAAVALSLFTDFDGRTPKSTEQLTGQRTAMLDELEFIARRLA